MTFFQFRYGIVGDRTPWGVETCVPWQNLDWFLPNGERARLWGGGPAETAIEGGTTWTDIFGTSSASPHFFLSERVVRTMQKAGVAGVDAYPVKITQVKSKGLQKKQPWPNYFYLGVYGHIDIDHEAGRPKNTSGSLQRFTPILETWDGSDVFVMRNEFNRMVFCTQKVLELARQHRWSNFMFRPMDVLRRYGGQIDYLAEQWPPESWYPTPPSAGKTMQEWIDVLLTDEYVGKAAFPLLDFGDEAIRPLLALLDDPSLTPLQRYNVADALRHFKWEFATEFPPDAAEKMERALAIDIMAHIHIPPPPGVSPE